MLPILMVQDVVHRLVVSALLGPHPTLSGFCPVP